MVGHLLVVSITIRGCQGRCGGLPSGGAAMDDGIMVAVCSELMET